jgi:CheY-like chemotaxis protein
MSDEQNGPLRVIAVDDSPSVIAHFKQLVSEMTGIEVIGTAKDGLEALALLKEKGVPDLVVMDIVMPRMDGLTTLRTMKASYPDIRVAMLSSVAGSRSRAEEAFRLGAVQVITKPFDGPKLRDLFGAEKTQKGRKG